MDSSEDDLLLNNTKPASGYKIGDLYPTDKNPIGVVFEISNQGKNGKILSLDQKNCQWRTSLIYSGATDQQNGITNLNKITSIDPSLTQFPAFKFCANKRLGGLTWYLPIPLELQTIYYKKAVLNASLSRVGTVIGSEIYWSSIDFKALSVHAQCISMQDNSGPSKAVNSNNIARAVAAF